MKKREILSNIIREFENEIGTSALFLVTMNTLQQAIISFKPQNEADFRLQIKNVMADLCNTKPRFGIFQYYIQHISACIPQSSQDIESLRTVLLQSIEKAKQEAQTHNQKMVEHAHHLPVRKKSILIYEQSHIVREVIKQFHEHKKHIRVVVAEQEYEKTHAIIEFLHIYNIPFQVVPDYMLSHVGDYVDMVFFGALTLQDTMEFVMPTGSHALISEFKTMNIPVYVFLQTTKFSLWNSEKKDIYHKKETRKHFQKEINYERLKFSHDRVHIDLCTHIITEHGILTPKEMKHEFLRKKEIYEALDEV